MAVRSMLETLQIPYIINTNMVSCDYYNHTIFEFTTEVAGQSADYAGGRYDGLRLLAALKPGCWVFGMGLERLLCTDASRAAGIETA